MQEIPYAPIGVVHLGFKRSEAPHPLDGFGFLVPELERAFAALAVVLLVGDTRDERTNFWSLGLNFTRAFGAGNRENHDASAFYARRLVDVADRDIARKRRINLSLSELNFEFRQFGFGLLLLRFS